LFPEFIYLFSQAENQNKMTAEYQDILKKVFALYIKYGIKSVTMDDVAQELGISKKTLYQIVKDKHELVQQVAGTERKWQMKSFEKILRSRLNAVEQLIVVIRTVNRIMKEYSSTYLYDLKKYYPELYRSFREEGREKMYNSMVRNIKQGKKEGLYRKELDEVIISKLYLIRVEAIQDSEIFSESEIHSPGFFREVLIYHIRGMATEDGLRVLEECLCSLGNKIE